ncbi:hypothetical protein IMZ08_03315 [Bacillus luteolus]|uniref:SbsC C-terminal domain-containing protein n=1 Tax=Litchfieldia luteola TaxID=682179 RepID=A0ABR9QF12_9BACI|nr:hypothetical protein [Cytobacillus luteolus]MBE4907086.1 hypothetical protein [Cytobacillus luteolus]MBP1943447.1 hypothetical protein [Cytobacillus luteolus]
MFQKSILIVLVVLFIGALPKATYATSEHIYEEEKLLMDAHALVLQAESFSGSLRWAISIEGTADGRTIPWDFYNGAVTTYKAAKQALTQLPNSPEKEQLMNRLEANVYTLISTEKGNVGRAVAYIDAVSAGQKIDKARLALEGKLANNILDDEAERLYHSLSNEIKKQAYLLDRVYGKTTRDFIRDQYKYSAEAVKTKLLYPISIKMSLDNASNFTEMKDFRQASDNLKSASGLMRTGIVRGFLERNPTPTSIQGHLETRYKLLANEIPMFMMFSLIDKDSGVNNSEIYKGRNYTNTSSELLNEADEIVIRLFERAAFSEVAVTSGLTQSDYIVKDFNNYDITINLNEFKNSGLTQQLDSLSLKIKITDDAGNIREQSYHYNVSSQ